MRLVTKEQLVPVAGKKNTFVNAPVPKLPNQPQKNNTRFGHNVPKIIIVCKVGLGQRFDAAAMPYNDGFSIQKHRQIRLMFRRPQAYQAGGPGTKSVVDQNLERATIVP